MTNISSEESFGLPEETVDLQLTTVSCISRNNGSDEEVKARDQSPDGRFLKFEEIGRGSFKTVFKGLDTTTGVNLAWCELQERLNKKERERFREEVEMLKTLQHSNIVRFHDYWEVNTPKRKYLVLITELMTSGTLKTYLKKLKKINTKVLKSWCRQILKGLNFLHSRTPPVIHRDLKCDNIFITGTNGTVKIGDLGLATLKTKSCAKSIIGTPEFIAPEMYDECYDESVDVYAFGMCMIEMATFEYPYSECNTPAQIYKKVTTSTPPQCYQRIDNPELKEIIGRCIAHKKDERPTVKELLKMEFLQEDTGFKIELVDKEKFANNLDPKIELRLIWTDAKKRKDKYKENEAIQFTFVIDKDNPDEVSMALVKNGYLTDEDVRTVASLIRSQIQCLKKEREKLITMTIQVDSNVQPICQQTSTSQQTTTTTQQQQQTSQQQQNAVHQTSQQQQTIHLTSQFNQQTPTTLTQNFVDQQTQCSLNQKQVGQECLVNNQDTTQFALHSQHIESINDQQVPQLPDQQHSDVNKLSNISKMSPLVMPLTNTTINNNLTQQPNENDNQVVSNHNGTVPSSPDCLSPGSPVKQTMSANMHPINHQNNFENSSITDLSSATNYQTSNQLANNITCQQTNSQITQQSNHTIETTNSALNQVQNQTPQSYSTPETPTTANQQSNLTNTKITDQVSINVNSNNLDQLSNSTNNIVPNASINPILPSQTVPSSINQTSNGFPAKAIQPNLENLKQGEKKLSSSISSNDLKVNIEQGLQAIFASSSCAQNTNPVASISNTSTTSNNGQSTPVLNSTATTQPSLIKIQQAPISNYTVDQQAAHSQPVLNNSNFCSQNIENNQLINHHSQQQSNHVTISANNQSESTPELNGQHGSSNLTIAVANSTPCLNDKEHSIGNPIYNNQPKEINDVKVIKSSVNEECDGHNQPIIDDHSKKRRFTIIPVEDDLVASPKHSMINHVNDQNLNNNNNQTESFNQNHQITNNSCSNSNTISSTSSLSKSSSTEEESSSLSGYSTPADSISQIKSRFNVTTIEESTSAEKNIIDSKKPIEKSKLLCDKFITRTNVVHQLIDALKSNDIQLKEKIIRFICLNYEEVSKQNEFRKLDKCILFEIMDEMANLYKNNSIIGHNSNYLAI